MICIEDICKSNDCDIVISDENGEFVDTCRMHVGDSIVLTYTPQECKRFIGWRDCDGELVNAVPFPELSEYSYKVIIDKCGCGFTAMFEPIPVELILTKNIDGAGDVSGEGIYNCGDRVTAVATQNEGFVFEGWRHNGEFLSTDISYSFTIKEDTELEAVYRVAEYNVYVYSNNSLWGDVSGSGTYSYGETAEITATPKEGCYYFVGWEDNNSSQSPREYVVTDNARFKAVFGSRPSTITTLSEPSGGGITAGYGTYDCGSVIRISAVAEEGWHFSYWADENGNLVSNDATATITVSGDKTYKAIFEMNSYRVNLVPVPADGGTLSGGGVYNMNSTCTINATPNPNGGYEFVEWTELGSTQPQNTFNVTQNMTLHALFKTVPVRYTVSVKTYGGLFCSVKIYKDGVDLGTRTTFDNGDTVTISVEHSCFEEGFDYWERRSDGVHITEREYTFQVSRNETYIAHFSAVESSSDTVLQPIG